MSAYVFTSESVSEGHPDKVADQISDAIVDLFLERDPESRCGVEALVTTNRVILAGEVRGSVTADEMIEAARNAIRDIGYEQENFHWEHAVIDCLVHTQSRDIAQGVDEGAGLFKEEGAGDQGIMFGFACNETAEFMPAPIAYSHRVLQNLAKFRKTGNKQIGPDSKSQITVAYENGRPVGTTNVLVSTQHSEDMSQKEVREVVRAILADTLPADWQPSQERLYVNPTGRFVIGGPDGDAGITGRKIIVDTYGGAAPHGGGAFSGKDPTKVDRSAAYAARYLAKNIVAAGLADKCTIQLSYAIGVAKPLSIFVDGAGTARISERKLASIINEIMDLTPKGIRKHFKLNRPIYKCTASYGHFGRTPGQDGSFPWEKTDLIDAFQSYIP